MTIQPWFERAKLGIFIHWGVHAVKGVAEIPSRGTKGQRSRRRGRAVPVVVPPLSAITGRSSSP